tara:strand:- start:253 stop:528 length:276 start_codon:yes stop_codon:yes gene_type:complete
MGEIIGIGDVGDALQRRETIETAKDVAQRVTDGDWKNALGMLAVVITEDSLISFTTSKSVDEATAITLATVVTHALCPLLISDEMDFEDDS